MVLHLPSQAHHACHLCVWISGPSYVHRVCCWHAWHSPGGQAAAAADVCTHPLAACAQTCGVAPGVDFQRCPGTPFGDILFSRPVEQALWSSVTGGNAMVLRVATDRGWKASGLHMTFVDNIEGKAGYKRIVGFVYR
jgi:hypothetical protein